MPYKNPEDHAASQRRSYAKRRDKIRESKKLSKIKKADGRERPKVCDVCQEADWRIVFDHCHASGKFRGWLCYGCNLTLGHAKDNPERLRALADYIEKQSNEIKCAAVSERTLGESPARPTGQPKNSETISSILG